MRSLFHSIIRTSAFFRKEIVEVLRQPRLIITLVLGPFIILLLYAVGYNNQPPVVRALFVADPTNPLAPHIQSYASALGSQLIYAGMTPDQGQAMAELQQGNVDVVVVVPSHAYQTINDNHQAVFIIYDR
ncbi:MAG: hypothetical protein M1281_15255 [Chloroflexi bacterium]|nr:hypothetical protein [Chloroflexota bacterium]